MSVWTKEDLKQALLDAKTAYYAGNPVMSDAEYDVLEAMWREAYPDEELTIDAGQKDGVFTVPYLSLDKVDVKGLRRWLGIGPNQGLDMDHIVVLPKIDGVSMEVRLKLVNNNLYLHEAFTRGGFNITTNVKRCVNIFNDLEVYSRDLFSYEQKIDTIIDRFVYKPETGEIYTTHTNSKKDTPLGSLDKNGYLKTHIVINGQDIHVRVHKLAWRLYYGEWPKYTINHKNGIKTDNRIDNLEDVTHRENQHHKIVELGQWCGGESNGNSILHEQHILEIKEKYKTNKHSMQDLADEYGVSKTQISRIVNGESWKHLTEREVDIIIRGEVFFNKEDLPKLKEAGFTALRNAAAGLLNPSRKDFNVGNIPKMKFLAWRWVNSPFNTYKESLDYLTKIGLPVAESREDCTIFNIELLENDINIANEFRNAYPFELDGLVIFKNYFSEWIPDGDTKYYRNAIAWKFASPVKESKIEKIEWSLGVSGYVTPVAVVEPVEVGGVVITHVNLHNPENMINLKAFPGAIAKIRRAGDVIPHIAEVCQYETPIDGEICTIPENCPRCDTRLHSEGPRIKCVNDYCDSRIEGVVYKWVDAHEWKYFSEEAMRDMLPYFKQDYHPLILIYSIDGHTLNQFMTSGKADRLWKHYQEAVKRTTPATLLASLNIPMIGVKNAEKILEQTETLVQLPSVLKEKQLNGTISVAEGHLLRWIIMHGGVWLHILNLANQLNVKVEKVEKLETKGRIVITGELPGCTRDEAFLVLKSRGYEPSNSLSKTTLYLITENPDTTTTKAQKARKYGVPIISWSEFLKISEP